MKVAELNIVKKAILNEVEGYEFYRMASHHANSKEVRYTFMELAAEELEHINWLKDFYTSIKSERADEFRLGILADSPIPRPFRWENLNKKDAAVALSASGIGIQMEKAAVEFYQSCCEQTKVMESRELFGKLSEWEQTHLDQFSSEYSRLTEGWWTGQGILPF